jgi:hypothetical protein
MRAGEAALAPPFDRRSEDSFHRLLYYVGLADGANSCSLSQLRPAPCLETLFAEVADTEAIKSVVITQFLVLKPLYLLAFFFPTFFRNVKYHHVLETLFPLGRVHHRFYSLK